MKSTVTLARKATLLGGLYALAGTLALGALCTSGNALAATIVYNNLGIGGSTYNDGNLYNVLGSTVGGGSVVQTAFSFTPSSTVSFIELDIALSYQADANSVTVDLMSDASGSPGSVLESWGLTGLPAVATCCTLQTLTGNGTIPLVSGTLYWVAVLPGNANTYAAWDFNSTNATGPWFDNFGAGWASQGSSATVGAFEVQGTTSATPEPGSLALVGTVIAWFLTLRFGQQPRRRGLSAFDRNTNSGGGPLARQRTL